MQSAQFTFSKYPFLKELGLSETNKGTYRRGEWVATGDQQITLNPHNGEQVASVTMSSKKDYQECVLAMEQERKKWVSMPAPQRGEIVRQIGDALR
mmetsp:Transcript_43015/g.30994  ORF Transcript_43015/g.30994 Transcript_43015/m.30994 type:complete len:96 (+) Transcript_43015:51-338(+)